MAAGPLAQLVTEKVGAVAAALLDGAVRIEPQLHLLAAHHAGDQHQTRQSHPRLDPHVGAQRPGAAELRVFWPKELLAQRGGQDRPITGDLGAKVVDDLAPPGQLEQGGVHLLRIQ